MVETTLPLEAPPEARLNPITTLFGVLFRPRMTFGVMRDAAQGYWWFAAILTVLSLLLATAAQTPLAVAASQAELATLDEESFSEEELAQIQQTQGMFTSPLFLGGLSFAGGLLGVTFNYLIRAGILYVLGLALGGRASFKQVFRMAVWTTLPDIVRNLIGAVAVFSMNGMPIPGLTYIFTGEELAQVSPILLAFLSNIDVYTIWSLALIGVGVGVTYQVSTGKSILITVLYWVIGIIFILALAAINQAIASAFVPGAG